jgi:hypothetical protein
MTPPNSAANSRQTIRIYLYKDSVQQAYIKENTIKAALLLLCKEIIDYPEEDLNRLSFTISDRGKSYHVNAGDFQKFSKGEISAEELLKQQ